MQDHADWDENLPTSAEEFIAASTRVVTLSTRQRVRIRSVARDELLAKGVLPPDLVLAVFGADPKLSQSVESLQGSVEVMDAALSLGMIEPRAWAGPIEDCPPGHVHVRAHLADVREELFRVLMGMSGYDERAAQAAQFRSPRGQIEPDPGPREENGPDPDPGAQAAYGTGSDRAGNDLGGSGGAPNPAPAVAASR